jgi:hypothetical protein
MRCRSYPLHLGLGLMVTLTVPAGSVVAQSCTLEYSRANNMWESWGRGNLGGETITLQAGQRKSFTTDWAYEKQRNDGTSYYGSHLRRAVNRGAVAVQVRVRGPMLVLIKPGGLDLGPLASANSMPSFASTMQAIKIVVDNVTHYVLAQSLNDFIKLGGPHYLQPGDIAFYRHDLAEVSCPGVQATHAATAPPPEPPAQPVLLSLTGTPATATTSTIAVTVEAQDGKTGAPLTGEVSINGVAGTTGQPITFVRCMETIDITDPRGVTRTRTIRVPCEGAVKISGYPDTHFTF